MNSLPYKLFPYRISPVSKSPVFIVLSRQYGRNTIRGIIRYGRKKKLIRENGDTGEKKG